MPWTSRKKCTMCSGRVSSGRYPWMTMRSKQWYTKASRLPNSLQKVSVGPPSVLVSTPMIIRRRAGGNPERPVKDFHELKVWQEAHQLTLAVYQVTASFPREELYGLTSQLRRCSASIPANLAEGCGRNGDAEFARFWSIAMGSASELEYHLPLARDLKLIKPNNHAELSQRATELKRMLTALIQKLNT